MAGPDLPIHYVAHLARLELTPDEESQLATQLHEVLAYMDKLQAVDVSQVEPTAHPVPLTNVTRPDVARPSLAHDQALTNAPLAANGLFIVPKIIE